MPVYLYFILVSLYCVIVLVVLSIIYYCLLIIFHDIRPRMAVVFGKVNALNPSQDEWPLYVERLEHVFVGNGITDGAKKWAVFLSVIGASNYKLLSSLVAPVKPGEKEYSALVDKLTEHFTPAPLEIVKHYKCVLVFLKSETDK